MFWGGCTAAHPQKICLYMLYLFYNNIPFYLPQKNSDGDEALVPIPVFDDDDDDDETLPDMSDIFGATTSTTTLAGGTTCCRLVIPYTGCPKKVLRFDS